jgi:hypothetical protein
MVYFQEITIFGGMVHVGGVVGCGGLTRAKPGGCTSHIYNPEYSAKFKNNSLAYFQPNPFLTQFAARTIT